MNNRKVYIIILNWNGWRDSIECIRSCRELNYAHYEIILVDNGSSDDSVARLCKAFPDLNVVANKENLGFAGGNNVGIVDAIQRGADYIWLLNNDTRVDQRALSELVSVAEQYPDCGMVGSKIFLYDEIETLHFAGGQINFTDGTTKHLGIFEKDRGQYDLYSEVDYVTGCSLLAKTDMIKDIGLMPEAYFLYYEETDWCMQATGSGYSIRVAPKSKVYHRVSGSIENLSPEKQYYLTRNRLYFLKKYGKNISWGKRMKKDWSNMLRALRKGQFRYAYLVCLSYLHWLRGDAGPLHKRVKWEHAS